jgi:hypothetical protein
MSEYIIERYSAVVRYDRIKPGCTLKENPSVVLLDTTRSPEDARNAIMRLPTIAHVCTMEFGKILVEEHLASEVVYDEDGNVLTKTPYMISFPEIRVNTKLWYNECDTYPEGAEIEEKFCSFFSMVDAYDAIARWERAKKEDDPDVETGWSIEIGQEHWAGLANDFVREEEIS